jgi:hypothetical protein
VQSFTGSAMAGSIVAVVSVVDGISVVPSVVVFVGYGSMMGPVFKAMLGLKIKAYTPVLLIGILTQLLLTVMLRDTQLKFELVTVARHTSVAKLIEVGRFNLNSNLALFWRVWVVELAFVILNTGYSRLLVEAKSPLVIGKYLRT